MFGRLLSWVLLLPASSFTTWVSIKVLDLFVLDTAKTVAVVTIFTISSLIGILFYIISAKTLHVEEIKDYQVYFNKIKHFLLNK